MLGIIYLLCSAGLGYLFLRWAVPDILDMRDTRSIFGPIISKPNWITAFPASVLSGLLLSTSCTYALAYLFHPIGKPMLIGNILTFISFAASFVWKRKEILSTFATVVRWRRTKASNRAAGPVPVIFLIFCFLFASSLMIHTFSIEKGDIIIGSSVVGDFGLHLPMMRSFSKGFNFPSEYPLYPDGHMRYHFFFDFLAGNLEYLGLRLDWAMNIPSIIAMVSVLMFIFSLSVKISGRQWVGAIACLLFMFRSSFAFFTYLSEIGGPGKLLPALLSQHDFIGKTYCESYGLWTLNVWVNQRFFLFSVGEILLSVLILIPCFQDMIDASPSGMRNGKTETASWRFRIREFFFARDAWMPSKPLRALGAGAIIGLTSYWNGVAVISGLLILFIMAFYSKHRLEFGIAAGLALAIALLESRFFMGTANAVNRIVVQTGFFAPRKDVPGVVLFYVELFGILPAIMLGTLFVYGKAGRRLTLAFLAPFIFANIFMFYKMMNNHKFMNVSIIFLNILAACFIYKLFLNKKTAPIAALLLFLLTVSGMLDTFILYNVTRPTATRIATDNRIVTWALNHTGPRDVFLTSNEYRYLKPLLLSGRKVFYGCGYCAADAGYDTMPRAAIPGRIFNSSNADSLKALVRRNRIDYIVVDAFMRDWYQLNEKLIAETFRRVFEDAEDGNVVYRTSNPRL
jgi:hypothetical protein